MPPLAEKLKEAAHWRDEGQLWRSRALLQGLRSTHGYSPELFALLGDVHLRMKDLPAAGAVYHLHGAKDDEERNALQVFRRQCGGDARQMALRAGLLRDWMTIPDERLMGLREELGPETWASLKRAYLMRRRPKDRGEGPRQVRWLGALVLVLMLFAFVGVLVLLSMAKAAIQGHLGG